MTFVDMPPAHAKRRANGDGLNPPIKRSVLNRLRRFRELTVNRCQFRDVPALADDSQAGLIRLMRSKVVGCFARVNSDVVHRNVA